MKKLINLGVLLTFVVVAMTSCTNSKQEEKIAALEERIKELEGDGKSKAQPKQNPTSLAANVDAESTPEGPLGAFKFEQEEFDFGAIEAGTVIEHTFKFTNVGEAPLIIQSATASCGCTVPKKPSDPIPVGGTGEIGVRYDSKNKSGVQSPVITIRANTDPNVTRIKLKGSVNPKKELPDGPVRK
ncbi:DUF1573 domain-containing protein [Fulvivirgaceae bacterium BMA12]|uniref:DUF1573 domain-containing protein n=1 Tax=Agaribacillus aureus TaxID=3051825 RepID=A0ABT8LE40_9BACT|nr:DUF1573 domain-containing protein [Fulvivirgaceae bacterium BMA12]